MNSLDVTMSDSADMTASYGTSRFLAFFDECGDHSLDKIDRDFPVFVLALVVVERDAYRDRIIPEFNRFKLHYFDHEGINLHSRDIRLASGPFSILLNRNVRPKFMEELSAIMEAIPFTLFISAIRKQAHLELQGKNATNPYDLALEFTMARLLHFLDTHGETRLPIVAEARGKLEDNMLEKGFYQIMTRGTATTPATQFKKLDCSLAFQAKKNNIVGVQIADLCAHPCARRILNASRLNRAFEVAERHIYQSANITGWKVFP